MIGPGSAVGRFRLERILGSGAMGEVYYAVDPEIERPVAIKVVRADAPGYQDRRVEIEGRFLKEAKIAGRLQHPNIVTIYDVGRDGQTYFIAMEYVEGEPLSRRLRSGDGLTQARRLSIAREVAEALAHAHDRGVIHRDVKPANVLVRTDGVAKVSDFGIGKLLSGDGSDLTRTGQMVGSPSYMSPEQIKGEPLDGRSDLFSLGIVCYEMFFGERPFPADSLSTLVYQILNSTPRDPRQLRPDASPELVAVVSRLLAKRPADRFTDARQVAAAFTRLAPQDVSPLASPLADALPARAEDVQVPETAGKVTASASSPTVIVERRGGAATLFGVAALVLAAAALIYVVFQSRRTAAPARVSTASTSPPAAATAAPPSVAPPPATAATPAAKPSLSLPAPVSEASSSAASAIGEPEARSPVRAEQKKTAPPPERTEQRKEAGASPATPVSPPPSPVVYDNVYRTRHAMQFQISPDQARLDIDGRYVGIADDWDNHGGGKNFPLTPGVHTAVARLPGYRDLTLQIVVTPSAKDDVVSAGDELKRLSRVKYPKIPKVDYETISGVYFDSRLSGAQVIVDGESSGLASRYSPTNPLRLTGPLMHDIRLLEGTLSTKDIRVLCASTAGEDSVKIREKLKEGDASR